MQWITLNTKELTLTAHIRVQKNQQINWNWLKVMRRYQTDKLYKYGSIEIDMMKLVVEIENYIKLPLQMASKRRGRKKMISWYFH